jgi:translation initiation factor 2 subunit 2
MSETANPPGENEEVDVVAMFDLTQKKKKKKKKTEAAAEPAAAAAEGAEGAAAGAAAAPESEQEPLPTYSYSQLLQRVVDLLHENNPELTEKRRYTMKPPQLMKGRPIDRFVQPSAGLEGVGTSRKSHHGK